MRPKASDLPHDLSAAVTVALVSIAEGMAYAAVAGVNPVYGIYSGIVTVIIGSLLSSTSLLMITLTNALALVTADRIGALGDAAGSDPTTAALTLTVLVGVVMAALGLMRLGSIVRFISAEVQAGMVSAVALLIILGQLKDLVGYEPSGDYANKVSKAIAIFEHIGDWNIKATVLGVACIIVILILHKTFLRPWADIIVLAIATYIGWAFLSGIATVGKLPTGLDAVPHLTLPDVDLIATLIPAAIAAAIVGLSESATVGAAYPNRDGSRSSMSQDFFAQGAANIAGGFFGSLPSGGSLSRTGVSVSAGARSRWAGVYAGAFVLIIVMVASPVASEIPKTVLAAILIVIGALTTIAHVRELITARYVSKTNLIAGVLTVIVGVFFDLTSAIFLGVALSLMLYAVTASNATRVVQWIPDGDTWKERPAPHELESNAVTVVALSGPMNFATVYKASELFPEHRDTSNAVLVIEARGKSFSSLSGTHWFTEFVEDMQKKGNRVILADMDDEQEQQLRELGLLKILGDGEIEPYDPVVGEAARRAYETGVRSLGKKNAAE